MSRLGKLPIQIPDSVNVKIEDKLITVKGPKGELSQVVNDYVAVELKDKEIIVSVKNATQKKERAFWGLYRSLLNNMVVGVSEGFEKKLEIVGVGYRVSLSGKKFTFNLGFSHQVEFILPTDISGAVDGNIVTISGFSKQQVGEVAAQIRKLKKPEPYKGKGIKYIDEVIIRKEGKTAAKGE